MELYLFPMQTSNKHFNQSILCNLWNIKNAHSIFTFNSVLNGLRDNHDCFIIAFKMICNCHTCGLHTNTIHGLIAQSSLPFSIHIHIHTGLASAWLVWCPVGNDEVPSINEPEVTSSLKAVMDHLKMCTSIY